MVFLDSDIIINFLRNDLESVRLISGLRESGESIKTTVINGFELWKGVFRTKSKEGYSAVEKFLEEVEIISLDKKSSKKAAEIFEKLKSKGEIVDALDIMIGAIVIVNNGEILTNNKRHFDRIPGIKLRK